MKTFEDLEFKKEENRYGGYDNVARLQLRSHIQLRIIEKMPKEYTLISYDAVENELKGIGICVDLSMLDRVLFELQTAVSVEETINRLISERKNGYGIYPALKRSKEPKNDRIDNKVRRELMPLDLLDEIAKAYTAGAEKYGANTWQDLEDGYERYKAACIRHII